MTGFAVVAGQEGSFPTRFGRSVGSLAGRPSAEGGPALVHRSRPERLEQRLAQTCSVGWCRRARGREGTGVGCTSPWDSAFGVSWVGHADVQMNKRIQASWLLVFLPRTGAGISPRLLTASGFSSGDGGGTTSCWEATSTTCAVRPCDPGCGGLAEALRGQCCHHVTTLLVHLCPLLSNGQMHLGEFDF